MPCFQLRPKRKIATEIAQKAGSAKRPIAGAKAASSAVRNVRMLAVAAVSVVHSDRNRVVVVNAALNVSRCAVQKARAASRGKKFAAWIAQMSNGANALGPHAAKSAVVAIGTAATGEAVTGTAANAARR